MVDRKNSKDAVKMMHHVGEDMKRKGVSLWIFPEGTRSLRKEDEMLPFKKGAFHLAVQGEFRCQSRVRLCPRGERGVWFQEDGEADRR
jgi:1-acyl-sn-glycerol-3-phosphate acyltransferase